MSGRRRWTVAAAQYPIDRFDDFAAWQAKLARWVAEAADAGAALAVFPEYGAIELTSLDPATEGDLHAAIAGLAPLLDRIDAAHAELAARHGIHILAASFPARCGDGLFRNHARLITPGGRIGVQAKIVMTRFEREQWGIAAGAPVRVFLTDLGAIGVSICYDAEFPLIARAQAEAGAELILVPSATDTLHGWQRVRTGAQARALENQCYVVQAPVVGDAPWTPALDVNRGAAGIYGPPDLGFPDDGVVAIGRFDEPGWVFGEIDRDKVAEVRRAGAVLNHAHWAEQPGAAAPALPSAEVIDLR